MFGKLGQIASLLTNLPKMQEDMKKFQQNLGQVVAEGDAGAGAVKVRVNGRMEILGCTLQDSTLQDKELLEDLIKAATNQALAKVRQQVMEEYSRMFAGMGLPPGLSIPGMM